MQDRYIINPQYLRDNTNISNLNSKSGRRFELNESMLFMYFFVIGPLTKHLIVKYNKNMVIWVLAKSLNIIQLDYHGFGTTSTGQVILFIIPSSTESIKFDLKVLM